MKYFPSDITREFFFFLDDWERIRYNKKQIDDKGYFMEKKASVHSGHRQRLKEAMLKSDFQGASDINLLEAILFYSIRRSDTNETAHKLLEAFGAFEKVFEADEEDLKMVEGIGENSAFLIKLIGEATRRIHFGSEKKAVWIHGNADAARVLEPYFIGQKDEVLFAMYMDNGGKLIRVDKISTGSVNIVGMDNRKLLEGAIRTNAASVILAHNHPHGFPNPSREDLRLTAAVRDLLSTLRVDLYDHLITGGGEWRSVREREDALKYLSVIRN